MKLYILLIIIFSFIFLLSSTLIIIHLSNKSSLNKDSTETIKSDSSDKKSISLKKESHSSSSTINLDLKNNKKRITWNEILNDWENGKNIPFFEKNIIYKNNNFLFWITTPIYNGNLNSIFKQNFVPNNHSFSKKNIGFIDKLKNDNHVRFLSREKNILLSPKFDNKFISIKHFISEASIETQESFWKFVSKEIKNILNENMNKTLYIFTDGRAEPYLHVRIQINNTKHYDDIKKKI